MRNMVPPIGRVRRTLMIRGCWQWNGWIRDVTAKMEAAGWLRSGV